MFVRVQPDEMLTGTKYKITVSIPNHIEFDKYSGVLTNKKGCHLTFDQFYDLIKKECSDNVLLLCNNHRSFYRFVSNNPRWQMERRTVNLILRRLIGDDNFEW